MKIKIVKKSGVVKMSDSVCPWMIEVPEEKR